jgi:ethanolamine utilization protein EutJ
MKERLETVRRLMNRPDRWDFSDAETLYAGVDLGTWKAIVVVVDETGRPRAVTMRRAEVVRSGMILDYFGALRILREMVEEIRGSTPLPLELGATSYPPRTSSANVDTTTYILEGAGLEVLNVLDEPTAANRVLGLRDGVIVDVGGGTTGIAVMENGRVVHSDDEATGGLHLSLVLAGHLGTSVEQADALKSDAPRNGDILPIVRPVIEKMASIVDTCLLECGRRGPVWLVGGTCELSGFAGVFGRSMGVEVSLPPFSQGVTPLGIALSCLAENDEEEAPGEAPPLRIVS